MQSADFTIIGENIHTTRIVMRNGKRVGMDNNGNQVVLYKNVDDNSSMMPIPDAFKKTQVYQEGRVKHFMIAVTLGMSSSSVERKSGEDYILSEIIKQERAGSNFLDLNIDEISYKLDIQKEAMKWLVGFYASVASIPPSIDSSSTAILEVGLAEYKKQNSPQGNPLVNSASLERIDILDIVLDNNASVVVTASGSDSMPTDAKERFDNASLMIGKCLSKSIPLNKIHVDALLFPISVDQQFGHHYLDAVKMLRKEYGPEINISGGLSNVSFGLPARKLINDTFIRIAVEAGVDSGIINPVESNLDRILNLDMSSNEIRIALEMLLGQDEFCMNFIKQYREGNLKNY